MDGYCETCDEPCWGFGGVQCANTATYGYDFCDECHKKLKQKRAQGLCTARAGKCVNKRVRGHSWCRECYAKFGAESCALESAKIDLHRHEKECNRGGVICSSCDYYFDCVVSAKRHLRKVQS